MGFHKGVCLIQLSRFRRTQGCRCQVFIALLSFLTDEPSSEGPLSFSLSITGSWGEQKAGGFSVAPLITKERQLAVPPTQSVSQKNLNVWLKPNKYLTLILPSLPLDENESSKGVSWKNVGAVWLFTKKTHGHKQEERFPGVLEFSDFQSPCPPYGIPNFFSQLDYSIHSLIQFSLIIHFLSSLEIISMYRELNRPLKQFILKG